MEVTLCTVMLTVGIVNECFSMYLSSEIFLMIAIVEMFALVSI